MLEQERLSTKQIVQEYKEEVRKLSVFLPWLEAKRGQNVVTNYTAEQGRSSSMEIPVYDSTLLQFVNYVKGTMFIDKNYAYVYSRYQMKDSEDELRMIARATIRDMDLFKAILSKYVLKGMTKGAYWKEASEQGIFYAVVAKMKELIEFWDEPMRNEVGSN